MGEHREPIDIYFMAQMRLENKLGRSSETSVYLPLRSGNLYDRQLYLSVP